MNELANAQNNVAIIGVHPIQLTPNLLREIMLRWHGPDSKYESESELEKACNQWQPQTSRTMKDLYLI